MLALMGTGVVVLRGLHSGAIVPTEVVPAVQAWWSGVTAMIPTVLTVAAWTAGALVALALAVLTIRHGRAGVRAWLAALTASQ